MVAVGYMANNLLPVRLGELVRSYYLARREPVRASTALATIIVERVFDGLVLLFFFGGGRALPPGGGPGGTGLATPCGCRRYWWRWSW